MSDVKPSEFFKNLADDTRLTCLLLIADEGELCVCELTEALNEIQPKVSRHLALLKQHNLLADRRQGQWVFYQLHPGLPHWQHQLLMSVAVANANYMKTAKQRLLGMADRPDRASRCC